jgi:hypothetical protein
VNITQLGITKSLDEQHVTAQEFPNNPDWVSAHSIPCECGPELAGGDATQVGHISMAATATGCRIQTRYKPGIPDWALTGFRGFAAEQVYAFLLHGPDPRDWSQLPDGAGWQMTVSYRQAEQFREGHLSADAES